MALPPIVSRRLLLKYAVGTTGLLLAAGMAEQFDSEAAPILVNHLGYPLAGEKICLLPGSVAMPFVVNDAASGTAVYRGVMRPVVGDFGPFLVGDFSDFRQSGTFQVQAGG